MVRQLIQSGWERIKDTQTARHLAPYLARDLQPDRWIFIVGCYNSGTTILTRVLGEHPAIGTLPGEGTFFTDVLRAPEDFGWPRMWACCKDDVCLKPGAVTEQDVRRIKRQWSIWYPKDTPNLLEKSVANALRIEFLQAHFAPAYFIEIVRNGYAVAEGIQRRANLDRWPNPEYKNKYPIELCARQWVACCEAIEQSRPDVDRFLRVRYEDFVRDTKGTLDQITRFLRISPIESSVLHRTWSFQEMNEPIKNMNPSSFERLSPRQIRKIEDVAGDVLRERDYPHLSSEQSINN
ncbi:sulfotransferase family protein [Salinibacter ruber]|uniref:sulfotransferase family protein n=1 Tax=Salinibacter ruber TaxID=146919 RepID=UPI002169E426|nr:sulfotransferase [Salinibacter ruber]MCS3683885.1 hypothetical protein [Salinibacter ruber]